MACDDSRTGFWAQLHLLRGLERAASPLWALWSGPEFLISFVLEPSWESTRISPDHAPGGWNSFKPHDSLEREAGFLFPFHR